jgi:putative phosphoribosyl transferase
MRFRNRRDAGRRLADALQDHRGRDDVIVLGLARGGVPVAVEVARALELPVDAFAVRKLGAPGQPELAMGAIASGGLRVLNEDVIGALGLEPPEIERAVANETIELERRERAYRGDRDPLSPREKTVLLIDDGLATGSTMEVAVKAVRAQGAASVVVAVPTGPPDTCERLRSVADAVVCLDAPPGFFAVGQWYEDFTQTSDAEVIALLNQEYERGLGGSPGEEHAWR